MTQALEIVRFRVHPDRVDALLATRDEALAALRAECPGLLSAEMVGLGGDLWLDLARWESMEQALAAAERAMAIPTFARWCEQIDEVISCEHASLHPRTTPIPEAVA